MPNPAAQSFNADRQQRTGEITNACDLICGICGVSRAFRVLNGRVSCVCKVVCAFGGFDGYDEVADVAPGFLDGPFLGGAHAMLDLGEACSIDGMDGSCSRRRIAP